MSGAATPTSGLPPPVFVTDADGLDPNLILADMIAEFQSSAGRVLYPAQVERLLINLWAYREALLRIAIQAAGQSVLLAYALYPIIDYLGQLVGVTRLASQPAGCTLQFNLVSALTVPITFAAGTQVGTGDGAYIFATTTGLTIPAGSTTGTIPALATVPGSGGNGYVASQVSVVIGGNALLASVVNTTTTAGGSEPESDDHLRTRIQAAPNQFSNAGPGGAYRFFALSANPTIISADVTTPQPGTVQVFVLTGPIVTQPAASPNSIGIASSTVLNEVLAALSADTVRPLTDTVAASAVTEVDYTITAAVTLFSNAQQNTVQLASTAAATQLALDLANAIGTDIVPSQWIAALSAPGVFEATVAIAANIAGTPVSPQSDGRIALTGGQWANCTALNLTFVVGTEPQY